MTLKKMTDEIKIIGDKIKANQAQYNLYRKAAKISALSSKEVDKYQYLTGEDLGYKPGVVEQDNTAQSLAILAKWLSVRLRTKWLWVRFQLESLEQAKFEHFPSGKVFNKGLEEDDKKEGLLKRLKILKARIKSS